LILQKKLEYSFIAIIILALSAFLLNTYNSYSFKHNPLPQSYIDKIEAKEQEILSNMQKNFGFVYKFPIIITDKIPGRLYGLSSYRDGDIKIYLNKKVMQESMDYILSDVVAHEYAHALLFKLNHFDKKDGHSNIWQQTCTKLGGENCRRYVDTQEIIMSKIPFK